MSALLQLRDLAVRFGHGDNAVDAVKQISFDLNAGEAVAIVGESGSGKSVTALSILQLLPYPQVHHPAGSIVFDGAELIGCDADRIRQISGNRISMIFQEPMTSLNPLHTVEKQISEVLFVHKGLGPKQARVRTLELLDLVGIRDAENRLTSYPHQLSGGQRQRVMIAMALANEPEILIADEPTTALDVTIQAQILKLLDDLRRRLGMALVLITHDLGIVRKMADRVIVMTDGQMVEHGPTQQIFEAPAHPYTQKLLAAVPRGQPAAIPVGSKEILRAKDLRVWFPIKRGLLKRTIGHVKAVDGVSLTIRAGETIGVVGESGSGKTTLAMALLQLQKADGWVTFDGASISGLAKLPLRALRRRLQVVFQDPYGSLSPRLTIGEIIAEGLRVHHPQDLGLEGPDGVTARVADALREVGLEASMMDRYPHEFSGGQRQRISIARALVLRPEVMVLDEPTSALDMSVQAQIVDLLRDLQRRHGLAYLFISHDLKVVQAMAHDIIVMRDGVVVERGPTADIIARPKQAYTQALMAAAFDLEAGSDDVLGQ
jgi:microcin C transport system ATP-binding protein